MPDKWEYPWFAAWDWAFHCVVMAMVDSRFAKQQLRLLLSDNFLNLDGQIPAYEWSFSDVNPPVQAWAAWKIYQDERHRTGHADRIFLEEMFHRLLGNYYWWLNREDKTGQGLFQGGFLGLDNIAVFNRSKPLPTGGYLEQADGTAWMAMYSLNMLLIALELNRQDKNYQDIAVRFLRQFLNIAAAMNRLGADQKLSLWDEQAGFYFSAVSLPGGKEQSLKVYSLVGLAPLLAVMTMLPSSLAQAPAFAEELQRLVDQDDRLLKGVASLFRQPDGQPGRQLLAIANPDQLTAILRHLLSEDEFLSAYGIRSISRQHAQHPYVFEYGGNSYPINYEPAESTVMAFGGNSNWRGPIWLPMNYLLIESLQRYYRYLGDDFKVECPTSSGQWLTLMQVAENLSQRLLAIFRRQPDGRRPLYGDIDMFQHDPHWRDLLLFHEYFHGDNGTGLGASQQAGWTVLVAKLLDELQDPDFSTFADAPFF